MERYATATARIGLAAALTIGLIGLIGGERLAQAAPSGQGIAMLVNSADFGGPDQNPGDGVCDAGGTVVLNGQTTPRCTLRAAIEEANATAQSLRATSGDEVLVTLDPDFVGGTITATNTPANFMQTTPVTDVTTGPTWFVVAQPMTIDLKNSLKTASAGVASVVFALTGTNITVTNASGILGGDTSFVIGGASSGVTIDSGQTYQTTNNFTKRFVLINNGASGFTLKNYKVGGLDRSTNLPDDMNGAVVFTPASQSSAVTTDVLIDTVDFTSPRTATPSNTTCSSTNGSGCTNSAVIVSASVNLNGFEMARSTLSNLYTAESALSAWVFRATWLSGAGLTPPAPAGSLANINIHDNVFRNNISATGKSMGSAMIVLPNDQTLGGTNFISNNIFDNSGLTQADSAQQQYAIGWDPKLPAGRPTTPSDLTIADNYFDGFKTYSIVLSNAGLVSVERNTFGPKSASAPVTAESSATQSSAAALFVNGNSSSTLYSPTNELIQPWNPTVLGAVSATCGVSFTAAQAGTSLAPAKPLRLDVFWTATTKAEKYLYSTPMNLTGTSTTITVQLPPEAIVAGASTGYIRLQAQTQGPNGSYAQIESSQYSTTLSVAGKVCAPPVIKATELSRTHGPTVGGPTLTILGQGFDAAQPSVSFQSGGRSATCANLVVVSPTELTCTIPASPLAGNGTGPVDVVVSAGGKIVGTFAAGYTYGLSSLSAVAPAEGSIEGSANCGATGSGLVTPIDGLHFAGGAWIDTGVMQGGDVELLVDFRLDASGNPPGSGVIGAKAPDGSSLAVAVGASNNLLGTGVNNATLLATINTARHTVAYQASTWRVDGAGVAQTAGSLLTAQSITVGAINTGDATTGTTGFAGVIHRAQLWVQGQLERDLVPAAWTVGGVTVYGLQDLVSGELLAPQGAGGVTGTDNLGRALSVSPTTAFNGAAVVQNTITVTSDAAVSYACGPHAAGPVDVGAHVDGVATNVLVAAYLYWVDGELSIVLRAWSNADGLSYADIVDTPGHSGAVELPKYTWLAPGTDVWWTYTVSYVHTDVTTGLPSATGQAGPTGVDVTDSVHNVAICTVDLLVNIPVGCVSGPTQS